MAFWSSVRVTAVAAVLFYLLVRDVPPGMTPPGAAKETAGDVLRGLLQVWKTPGLGPVLAMHTFAYAVMLTVLGVWAGPYLHAVHGLDSIARGHVMLGMGLAQIIGILCYGPLDRLFGSRKKVVVLGVLLTTPSWSDLPPCHGRRCGWRCPCWWR